MITFSKIATIFKQYMIKPNITKIVNSLISIITNHPIVINSKGNTYVLDDCICNLWYHGKKDIYKNIKIASTHYQIINEAPDAIGELLYKYIIVIKHINLFNDIYNLVLNDDTIPGDIYQEIICYYKDGEYNNFMAKTFLYSVSNCNIDKKCNGRTKNSDLDKVKIINKRFNKIVNVLLINLKFIDNKKYQRYKNYYYNAYLFKESINNNTEKQKLQEILIEQIYESIIDIIESTRYDNITKMENILICMNSISIIYPKINQKILKGLSFFVLDDYYKIN